MFHTRQITFPILMSVYNTLECTSLDILRIPSSKSPSAHSSSVEGGDGLEMDDPEDRCLVAVDVRNLYGQPFEVTFEATQAVKGEILLLFLFPLNLVE